MVIFSGSQYWRTLSPEAPHQAETMKEYNRLLDEQEEQRGQELAARMERA